MAHGDRIDEDRIDEVVEAAVEQGQAPDGPLADTVKAERPVTVRGLLTFTWGFGMQGAMFMAPDPWPIVTAVEELELASFGPPKPDTTPEPDTWMARLGELPLLAQPGERWLYQAGSQVLGVLAARAAKAPFEQVGVSVLDDGRYTWEGGFGTAWCNVPSQDLTVVVLTQRAADETGLPAVCDDVLAAARQAG